MIRCTAFQTSMEAPESPDGGMAEPIEVPEDIDDEMKQALQMSLHGNPLLSPNSKLFKFQNTKHQNRSLLKSNCIIKRSLLKSSGLKQGLSIV